MDDKQRKFYRSGWRDRNAVKESDKEWIARGGHLGTAKAWHTIDMGQGSVHDWLNPHAPHQAEHDLWQAFWMVTIQDALGVSSKAKRPCVECHLDSGCVCFSNPNGVGRVSYAHRLACHWKPHTVQQCAINYINSDMAKEDADLMGIKIEYIKKLLTDHGPGVKRKLTSTIRRSAGMKVASVGLVLAVLGSGCASMVECQEVETVGGMRTYCMGKVAGDGQEAVFRDIYDEQGRISHSFGSGTSLWGQVLVGSGAAAVLSGGYMGAAALQRPDRDTTANATSVEVEKAEVQSLAPLGPVQEPVAPTATTPSININNVVKSSSRSKSTSKALSTSKGGSANANVKMGNIGGGSGGGVPGCQKAKFGC